MKNVFFTALLFHLSLGQNLSGQGIWHFTESPTGHDVACLLSIEGILYAGMGGLGLFKLATDGNWEACNSGLTDPFPSSIIKKGDYLFVGTYFGGVFRSADGGLNWTPMNEGLEVKEVWSLGVAGDLLLAGTGDGVYFSEDNGAFWKEAAMDVPMAVNKAIYSIQPFGARIVAGSSGSVWVSGDNGQSWVEDTTGALFDLPVLVPSPDGIELVTGSSGSGVLETSNAVTNWDVAVVQPVGHSNIRGIVYQGDTKIIATETGGVFQGLEPMNDGLPELLITKITQHGSRLYAGVGNSGVWIYKPLQLLDWVDLNDHQMEVRLFPNPASTHPVTFSYQLISDEEVSIEIYDEKGAVIALLERGFREKGSYEVQFEVSRLQAGTYYCHFKTSTRHVVKTLIVGQ